MATDAEDWKHVDWALFADLLQIQQSQLLDHQQSLDIDRAAYFAEIPDEGDLFLDPDTGIATGRVEDTGQYVFANEIHDILRRRPGGVLAVYQHIRAQKTRDRLHRVVSALKIPGEPFTCSSYESGTVAMLFLSRENSRVEAIHKHFHDYLGTHAPRRVYLWHHLQANIS